MYYNLPRHYTRGQLLGYLSQYMFFDDFLSYDIKVKKIFDDVTNPRKRLYIYNYKGGIE